jgi:hypothetical protein
MATATPKSTIDAKWDKLASQTNKKNPSAIQPVQ